MEEDYTSIIDRGNIEEIKILVEVKKIRNFYLDYSLLAQACINSDIKIIKYLIKSGFDINSDIKALINIYSKEYNSINDLEIFKYIITISKNSDFICNIADKRCCDILDIIFENFACCDEDFQKNYDNFLKLFCDCVYYENLDFINIFIDNISRKKLTICNKFYNLPFFISLNNNNKDIFLKLFAYCDPNYQDESFNTPLKQAIKAHHDNRSKYSLFFIDFLIDYTDFSGKYNAEHYASFFLETNESIDLDYDIFLKLYKKSVCKEEILLLAIIYDHHHYIEFILDDCKNIEIDYDYAFDYCSIETINLVQKITNNF